jgi:hypothetical protein
MKYDIRYTYGHYSVYTRSGQFLFTADTREEAWREIEAMEAAVA